MVTTWNIKKPRLFTWGDRKGSGSSRWKLLNYCLNINRSKWGSQRWTCRNLWIWRTYSSCPRKRSFILLLHKFLQFATNSDVMAFDMAKLTASTFGRLRVGTPRVYSWRSSECSNGRLWRRCNQYMIRWWHVISRPTVLLRNELIDYSIKRRSRRPAKQRSPSRLKILT